MTNISEQLNALQAENKLLRQQLAHAEQNYHNLFENIGDSVFIVDLATYQLIEVNEHAVRRFGYEHKEAMLGLSLDAFEVIDTPSTTQQVSWKSSFSGTHVYECHYKHHDGTLIPVEVSSRVVKMNGREVIQNFVRNIKVRKQMEEERQNLIEELDSFAHTVAHDLKSPVALIASYANFLQQTFESSSIEEIHEALRIIFAKSQRAISIVEELLLFANIRDLSEVQLTPLHMDSILRDVNNRLLDMLSHHQTHITPPDKWHVALGYAPWVQEVWVNYISNAIKYGGTPPHIWLGSDPLENGMVRFWVRDNGAGIATEELPFLFQKFSRLKNLRIEGHGLGLSIVKRIVERLGGEVGVQSTLGVGSTFWFTLPTALD